MGVKGDTLPSLPRCQPCITNPTATTGQSQHDSAPVSSAQPLEPVEPPGSKEQGPQSGQIAGSLQATLMATRFPVTSWLTGTGWWLYIREIKNV